MNHRLYLRQVGVLFSATAIAQLINSLPIAQPAADNPDRPFRHALVPQATQ